MDILTFETCWAVNSEIIKQVTSSWPVFIQLSVWNVGYNPKYYHRKNKSKVSYKSLCCSASQWPSHNTNNLICPISRYSQVTVEMHRAVCLSGTFIPASFRLDRALYRCHWKTLQFVPSPSDPPPITGCNVLTTDRALLTDLHNNNTNNEYITIYAEIFKRHLKRMQAEALLNVVWSYISQTS